MYSEGVARRLKVEGHSSPLLTDSHRPQACAGSRGGLAPSPGMRSLAAARRRTAHPAEVFARGTRCRPAGREVVHDLRGLWLTRHSVADEQSKERVGARPRCCFRPGRSYAHPSRVTGEAHTDRRGVPPRRGSPLPPVCTWRTRKEKASRWIADVYPSSHHTQSRVLRSSTRGFARHPATPRRLRLSSLTAGHGRCSVLSAVVVPKSLPPVVHTHGGGLAVQRR